MFGRRRYLPELSSGKHMMRAFGERVARNMPIQGTAADIIKIAMIKVDERMKKEGLQARLILQVHDELIVEAPENEKETVAKLLQEEMENAVKLSVPLTADAAVGRTWYDAKNKIMFVCTGNTCRSPMAEAVFNRFAEEKGLAVRAESMGTTTVTGMPVSENSVEVCKEIGIDISDMHSTAYSDKKLDEYDKFYCMSTSHKFFL